MFRIHLVLMIITSTLHFAQSLRSDVILIDSSYTNSLDKPLLILSGQLVNFEADSIYLVNKSRLRFYEDIRDQLVNFEFDCEHSLNIFRESFQKSNIIADNLIKNSQNTRSLNNKILLDTQLLLNRNANTLDQSIRSLDSAQKNLDKAKEELSRMRTDSFFDSIVYLFAGIGIGVIVGISIN